MSAFFLSVYVYKLIIGQIANPHERKRQGLLGAAAPTLGSPHLKRNTLSPLGLSELEIQMALSETILQD
jgi:hypothetical protein